VQGHNWTTLPQGVAEMKSLKTMRVNHGPLRRVPSYGEYLKLTKFDLSYNELGEIPVQFRTPNILNMKMANNNISNIPIALGGYKEMVYLELDNNNISEIPSAVMGLPWLSSFYLSNNTLLELSPELGILPSLLYLFVDGNNLTEIPDSLFEAVGLLGLKFQNNEIGIVPPKIGQLVRLNNIDLRYNSIKALPGEFAKLKKLQYAYFHGNPMCANGFLDDKTDVTELVGSVEGGCKAQCSRFCQDRLLGKGSSCGRECNSEACDYDGGLCVQS
jgi:Leucine-rich repeat (LRR) protein